MNAARLNWSAMPCPTPGWAVLVHPDLEPADAALQTAVGADRAPCAALDDPDPVAAWEERMDADRAGLCDALNERRLRRPAPRGARAPTSRSAFCPSSNWMGGGLTTTGASCTSPTCRPKRCSRRPTPSASTGAVRSTKPLELDGTIVRDFEVEFDGGRVKSDRGRRERRGARGVRLERDEGAGRLGEIALVDGAGASGRSRRSSTTR